MYNIIHCLSPSHTNAVLREVHYHNMKILSIEATIKRGMSEITINSGIKRNEENVL